MLNKSWSTVFNKMIVHQSLSPRKPLEQRKAGIQLVLCRERGVSRRSCQSPDWPPDLFSPLSLARVPNRSEGVAGRRQSDKPTVRFNQDDLKTYSTTRDAALPSALKSKHSLRRRKIIQFTKQRRKRRRKCFFFFFNSRTCPPISLPSGGSRAPAENSSVDHTGGKLETRRPLCPNVIDGCCNNSQVAAPKFCRCKVRDCFQLLTQIYNCTVCGAGM